jgi:two-component system sensor histidine kinase PilS (NtrC family)
MLDLKDWLEEIVQEFKGSQLGRKIDLETDFQDDQMLVLFDRSHLHQAIWKLIDNALRHACSENESPKVRLGIERQPGTGYCVITVEDNGPGISDDHIANIFEPFYTTHKHGSGLGLYIARQLCEVNQAELTVDSTLGSGTRFHVRLALSLTEKDKETQVIQK